MKVEIGALKQDLNLGKSQSSENYSCPRCRYPKSSPLEKCQNCILKNTGMISSQQSLTHSKSGSQVANSRSGHDQVTPDMPSSFSSNHNAKPHFRPES